MTNDQYNNVYKYAIVKLIDVVLLLILLKNNKFVRSTYWYSAVSNQPS